MIHIIPVAGLCNRMRALDSAVALARDLSLPITVYWQTNKDLNCPFDLLWEPIHGVEITMSDKIPKALRTIISFKKLRVLLNLLPVPAVAFSSREGQELKDFLSQNTRRIRYLYVKSYSRFYDNADPYNNFVPIQDIEELIRERVASFDQNVVGVHIRRTDHVRAIAQSPDALFIERMRHEIQVNPLTRFYLATDALEVKETFTGMFGDRILTTPYESSRTSVEGIQEALVELYALAATSKIFGSYGSSYSTTAGELGGIEVEHLTV